MKELYSKLCQEKYIPIHGQPWWLDAVCGSENWEVILAFGGSKNIIGALPYTKNRRMGLDMIRMPNLTSFLPIYIDFPDSKKQYRQYDFEHKVLAELISQIPSVLIFNQNYFPTLTNWLPFYWKDYRQTTRYTYVFDDLSNPDALYKKFNRNTRRNILKAEELGIEILDSDDLESFYKIAQMTFSRQNLKMPYSFQQLSRLDKVLTTRNQRKILLAKDSKNNIHVASYFIWDERKVYYLASGINTDFRKSGAHHLLIWTALKHFSGKGKVFDFEGTMLKSVEAVFRGLGARQVPYLNVKKVKFSALELGLELIGKW